MQQREERVNSQELTIGIVQLFNIFAKTNYSQKLKNQHQLWKEIISKQKTEFIKFLRKIQDMPEFQQQRNRFQQDILKHKKNWINDLKQGRPLYRLRDKPRNEEHYNVKKKKQ